jgi:hypothetical protein
MFVVVLLVVAIGCVVIVHHITQLHCSSRVTTAYDSTAHSCTVLLLANTQLVYLTIILTSYCHMQTR